MQNTGGEFKAVRRSFTVIVSGCAIVFNLFLSETGHRKEARTLGERIVVTQSHEPTIEVDIIRVVHVAVGDLTLDGAATQRVVGTEAHAVAINEPITGVIGNVVHTVQSDAGTRY